MRNYREEVEPIKDMSHKIFKFDIYKINKFEEWRKIKTIELINYSKKFNSGGSGGGSLYHRKNGKELNLSTIETYDTIAEAEKYGIYIEDKSIAFQKNYITLKTLNTLYLIANEEEWCFDV